MPLVLDIDTFNKDNYAFRSLPHNNNIRKDLQPPQYTENIVTDY